MSDACKGLFGRLFGHKYREAVNVEPIPFSLKSGSAHAAMEFAKAYAKRTVVGIYCARCGLRQEVRNG